MILFKKVAGRFGWMSNMSPHPVTHINRGICQGECLSASDVGVVVAGNPIAYAHPQCQRHNPVIEEGETFRTAEAYFQALRFTDRAIIDAIKVEKSPMAAKMVAKKHLDQAAVTPRSAQDLDNMRLTVGLKLKCHPALVQELLATGDEEIVEDVSSRPNVSGLFWGGYFGASPDALYERVWFGQNWLGKIWMEHRSALTKT